MVTVYQTCAPTSLTVSYRGGYRSFLRRSYYNVLTGDFSDYVKIKGVITESELIDGFRNCHHHNLTGSVYPKYIAPDHKEYRPGEYTEWVYPGPYTKIDFSTPVIELYLVTLPSTNDLRWWVTGNLRGRKTQFYEMGFSSKEQALAQIDNLLGPKPMWRYIALYCIYTITAPATGSLPVQRCIYQLLSQDPVGMGEPDQAFETHAQELTIQAMQGQQDLCSLGMMLEIASDGLICTAMDQIVKNLARATEATRWIPQGASLWATKKRITNLYARIQASAGAYLGYQYGVKAPFRDYSEFWSTIERYWKDGKSLQPFWEKTNIYQTGGKILANGSPDVNYSVRLGLHYDVGNTDLISDTLNIMNQYGFGLSFAKMWDLVPLSFAIDWVYNVSSVLETLDAKLSRYRCPIKRVWRSYKAERTFDISSILNINQWAGTITETLYDRKLINSLPEISTAVAVKKATKGTISTSSLDEAVALVVVLT